MTPSGALPMSLGIPIGLFENPFTVFQGDYWKIQLLFMQNLVWKAETGWAWTGESTTTKVVWTEIWGDGEYAAVKDGAAVVFISSINSSSFYCSW